MRIELPWPDPSLSPNRKHGRHWGGVHTAKVKRRTDAHYLTLTAMKQSMWIPLSGPLAVSLTFHAPDKRRRDLDNLLAALKQDFDGISQALGIDDQHFNPLTLRRGETVKGGLVIVEVTC